MINIFEPTVQKDSYELLNKVFESKWLGRGEYVNIFEEKLKDYLEINNLSTVSCASDAIFGSIKLFNFAKGSKIAIPVNSFPAIGSAIIENNLTPIFIDINPVTGNICIDHLKKYSNDNISAIFITHYGGTPVDVKKIRKIFDNTIILEDSACALGSSVEGVKIGAEADFSCWSFDAMKLITCGEGGAFSFKNKDLHNRAKEYFYLGLPSSSKSGLDKSRTQGNWWNYEIFQPGVRSVFTNINAAIGIPNLGSIFEKLDYLKILRKRYEKNLDGKIQYAPQDDPKVEYSNYFFTIFSKRRDHLARKLLDNGIYTTLRYERLDGMNMFSKFKLDNYPGADTFYSQALNIPIHVNLSLENVDFISETIIKYSNGTN